MKLIPTLLAATALCASAQADLLIVMRGTVNQVGPTPPAGFAFEGAQVGDSVRLAFSIATPGTTTNQVARFDFIEEHIDLEIGSTRIQSPILPSFPFSVGNDLPTSTLAVRDVVSAHFVIPGVSSLDFYIADETGQMLTTSDLTQSLGTFSTPGLSRLQLIEDTLQGNIHVDLNFMEVVELGPVGNTYCAPPVPNFHWGSQPFSAVLVATS